MRKILIITATLMAALLLLEACVPAQVPEQTSQDQLSFHLVSDAAKGDTDAYGSYIFNLYLENGHELNLAFSAKGAALMVSLFSPSEETYGYCPLTTQADAPVDKSGVLGQLKEGLIISVEEGSFIFTAPETGYYVLTMQSASPKAEIYVQLEYQIQ